MNAAESVILELALAVPLARRFDYLPPAGCDLDRLQIGMRVSVPFGRQTKVGVLLAIKSHSEFSPEKLKPALAVMDQQPLLSQDDLQLLLWASQYYHHPVGEVLSAALPVLLRQGQPAALALQRVYQLTERGQHTDAKQLQRASKQQALLQKFQALGRDLLAAEVADQPTVVKALLAKGLITALEVEPDQALPALPASGLVANADQQQAITHIIGRFGQFSTILLEGVTGSGKTEVYMQSIAEALGRDLQVLVLLPEISLTPQLEQRFRARFATGIVTYHSKLTDKQRLQAWLQFQQSKAAIMLGTRSALFTPFQRPGLIILDEEHDASFKQQEGFRFSARDVAIARAKRLAIPVVLGTATPSLESLLNAQRGRFDWLRLPSRAGAALPPSFQLLDIRNKRIQGGLSEQLISAIQDTLAQGQQVLLFLNRRGYAPVQICHGCGQVSRCLRCDANLVIHAADQMLRCHHCGFEQHQPKQCLACKTGELHALGMGTERIEQVLNALFPTHHVVRLDRDSTQRKGHLEAYLAQIHSGEAQIILGTQMLAKGHHFPQVTLVALLDVDSGLFSIDYRSGERLAQLIVQVAGRAGRADKPGRVLLQTRHPDHALLQTLLQDGYRAFAEQALAERCVSHLPPYAFQALIRAHAHQPQLPEQFLTEVAALCCPLAPATVSVLGPVTAPMFKRAGQFRYQLLLQSGSRQALHQLLDALLPRLETLKLSRSVKWSLDVDPQDLY